MVLFVIMILTRIAFSPHYGMLCQGPEQQPRQCGRSVVSRGIRGGGWAESQDAQGLELTPNIFP